MSLYRIQVLGATFFMVGLCPNVGAALTVFALGTAVYSLLWLLELFGKGKRE